LRKTGKPNCIQGALVIQPLFNDRIQSPRRQLRTAEAALYLGIGVKALRNFSAAGKIRYTQHKPPNGPFLYDIRDLDDFIESQKNHTPP
jgi:hypothetical protein